MLGDIRDRARLDQVLARESPDLVFHAAAFKHVPMVESNPNEGVLTNVVGTRNLADACRAAGIETMVMISTRSEEHTSELQSRRNLVCRLLLEKKKKNKVKTETKIKDNTS